MSITTKHVMWFLYLNEKIERDGRERGNGREGGRGGRGWQRERAEKRERVREGEIEGGWLGRSCWIFMLPYMRN